MTNDPTKQRTGLAAALAFLWPDSGALSADAASEPPPWRVDLANGLFGIAYTSLIGSILGAFLYGHWSGCVIPLALAVVLWCAGWMVFDGTRSSVRAANGRKQVPQPARTP